MRVFCRYKSFLCWLFVTHLNVLRVELSRPPHTQSGRGKKKATHTYCVADDGALRIMLLTGCCNADFICGHTLSSQLHFTFLLSMFAGAVHVVLFSIYFGFSIVTYSILYVWGLLFFLFCLIFKCLYLFFVS